MTNELMTRGQRVAEMTAVAELPHRLTPAIVAALRAPFPAEAVKWKVQTNPREGKDLALVVAYLDARDVAGRLDDATGGDWWDDYSIPQRGGEDSLECRLTVCGLTRVDVGKVEDARDTKDLYSDAFKRAGVKFGIGAFLYRFPTVYAKAKQFGKTWSLTDDARADLAALTDALPARAAPPRLPNLFILK
jgi:hypothetical protein